MAHLLNIQSGASMRAIATAFLLAVAVISMPVGQAHAEANNGGNQTTEQGCINPDTGKRDIAGGTTWESKDQAGHVMSKYTCNGKTGEWDKVTGPPIQPSGPRAPMAGGGVYAR